MDIVEYLNLHRGIKFTEQQIEMINHKDNAALVLAVPGAGKSTSLIARTANLIINHKVPADRILTMTFSKESAIDLKDRFNNLFGDSKVEGIDRTSFSTIHSFAYEVVREVFSDSNKLNKTIITGYDVDKEIANIYKSLYQKDIDFSKRSEVVSCISFIKNKMIDMNAINDAEIKNISPIPVLEFRGLYKGYYEYKQLNDFIDFDDMLTICYFHLLNNEKIIKAYRNKFDYIQLDEVQDTSVIQFAIVELLGRSNNNNLFYVGDLDQNIMGFRGTDTSKLMKFEEIYPGGTVYKLEQNFRSTKDIVSVASEFIKNNRDRLEIEMSTDKQNDRPIEIIKIDNVEEEAKYIIDKLNNDVNKSDSAVLYRNNINNIILVNELLKANLPFYIKSNDGAFLNNMIINDVLSFIRLSLDYTDQNNYRKIWYKNDLYLRKQIVERTINGNKRWTIDSLLNLKDVDEDKKMEVEAYIRSIKMLTNATGSQIIDIIFMATGYEIYLEKSSKSLNYSRDYIIEVKHILKTLTKDCISGKEVINRIDDLKKILRTSEENRGKNVVTLSTIHGAKGLEWEKVYIMSVVEDIFPSIKELTDKLPGDNSGMEEERRLCYVAITRSKSYVDILAPMSRHGLMAQPSNFTKEIKKIKRTFEKQLIAIENSKKYDFDHGVDETSLSIGDVISHEKYKDGNVISIDRDTNTFNIQFEEGDPRRFPLGILKLGFFSRIKDIELSI